MTTIVEYYKIKSLQQFGNAKMFFKSLQKKYCKCNIDWCAFFFYNNNNINNNKEHFTDEFIDEIINVELNNIILHPRLNKDLINEIHNYNKHLDFVVININDTNET
jgi:hypothetical protein